MSAIPQHSFETVKVAKICPCDCENAFLYWSVEIISVVHMGNLIYILKKNSCTSRSWVNSSAISLLKPPFLAYESVSEEVSFSVSFQFCHSL